LSERRVRFTRTAAQHVQDERTWWLARRDYQELFATEIESALQILAILPGVGTPYTQTSVPSLRRIYIQKLLCHVYYTFDDDEVLVRALWGAKRERTPDL